MKFFKNLFNFKSKKNQNEQQYLNESLRTMLEDNFISVVIDSNKKPIIRMNLMRLDNEDAMKYAETLFLLNNGSYTSEIMDMLRGIYKEDDESRKNFAELVVKNWTYYIEYFSKKTPNKVEKNDNAPCVSPMSFSKLVINNTGK